VVNNTTVQRSGFYLALCNKMLIENIEQLTKLNLKQYKYRAGATAPSPHPIDFFKMEA
jgi:hypothetical protein